MSPQSLIEHFGGVTATAKALGVKPPSVSEWCSKGRVPLGRQFQAQVVTRNKLRAGNGKGAAAA
ncbi:MAG: Cro/CI family transcriptional regulator [Bradyrhizobium sp.]